MAEKGNFDFIYNPIKEKMHEIISYINYTTYIEKLVPVDIDGRFIVLETPTESFAKYISGTLAEKMREAIIKADVGISDFRLKVEGSEGYAYNAPTEEYFTAPTNLDKNLLSTASSWARTTSLCTPRRARLRKTPRALITLCLFTAARGLAKRI